MNAIPAVRCLVVEDDASLRRGLARLLTSHGHAVREAGDGLEALDVLERDAVDLVLTDFEMPRMGGAELLAEVRRRWPDTGVIMVTGVTDMRTAVACLSKGALDYIGKPFQAEEVRGRVTQALEKRRLLLENRDYQLHLEERVEQQAARIRELSVLAIQALAHALEAKDAYTRGHSARVAAYATAVGRALSFDAELMHDLRIGAELHDIGKIGVREAVLLKPERLTPAEYEHIKEHPLIGERILQPVLGHREQVLAVVRWHHERPDGRGFPDQLCGSDVPLVARITAVADTFDAMTTARPYRTPRSIASALEELDRFTGSQFDPDVVQAFHRAFPDPVLLPMSTDDALAQLDIAAAVTPAR